MSMQRRFALLAAALMLLAGPVQSQEPWPAKPVRLIVPFAPGGSTDVIGRLVGQRLSAVWGQPVVVDNRAGAGGNLGADAVAKSTPDGYTLLMASGSITINPAIYRKMPFDTRKDLAPITNVAQGPMLVMVPDNGPHKSLQDLIAAAKARPGAINFGSAGVGSQVHLAAENLADAAGIDLQHVPYKGEALGYNDLMAGQVQLMVGNYPAASALLGPQRLRALAVTSRARMPQQPDVPTVAEAGLPGFENIGWFGLLAPAGTPAAVIDKVHRDTARVMADTEVKARLYVQGLSPVVNTPAEFAAQMEQDLARWARVAAARKLQSQ